MDNRMDQYENGGGYQNGGRGNAPGGGNNGNNGNNGNRGNNGYNRNNGGNGGPGNGGGEPPRRPGMMMMLLGVLCAMLIAAGLWNLLFGGQLNKEEVTYTQFLQYIEEDKVASVEVVDSAIVFELKDGVKDPKDQEPSMYGWFRFPMSVEKVYTTNCMESLDVLTARLEEHGIEGTRIISNNGWFTVLITLAPVLLFVLFMLYMSRRMEGMGPMSVGKTNARVYVQKETGVTFKDVAGADEAKESLVEVVDFLHNPGKYSKIGAKLPKGALLVGPPGTGKTLLAKAVAGEAKVPFFSLTGSDFIEMYVGVGASRVRDLFKEANKNAPCIIFIDEIDAIGRSRDSRYGGGGGEAEHDQTLNQLLSEMDGFDSSKGILILGATNRPETLDRALLRPGRFDRRIIVDKPDLKGRVAILKVHSKDVKMDESVDLDAIALATSGAVGSDLANMINEAAINAVKENRALVSQKDLFDAVEVVLMGKEKKDRIMSKEERRIVSYHEVGHALVSALQKNSEPVQKITIVPRTMGALGYVMHVPEEEKYLNSEEELRNMLVSLVGGRAAEEIVFDTVTTGAANDIERATEIARNMVTRYGMSKRFGLMGLGSIESQYLEGRTALTCSDATAAAVDEEVVAILKESYEMALGMLRENRPVMDKLAEYLIEKETITGKEFMQIYRREKGIPEPEEKQKEEKQAEEKKEDKPGDGELAGYESAQGQTVIQMPGPVAGQEETNTGEQGSFQDILAGTSVRQGEPAEGGRQDFGEVPLGTDAGQRGEAGEKQHESQDVRGAVRESCEEYPGTVRNASAEADAETDTDTEELGTTAQDDRPVGRFSGGRIE